MQDDKARMERCGSEKIKYFLRRNPCRLSINVSRSYDISSKPRLPAFFSQPTKDEPESRKARRSSRKKYFSRNGAGLHDRYETIIDNSRTKPLSLQLRGSLESPQCPLPSKYLSCRPRVKKSHNRKNQSDGCVAACAAQVVRPRRRRGLYQNKF